MITKSYTTLSQWRKQKISEGGQSVAVAKGGAKGAMPPKFLENIVILCLRTLVH